MDNVLEVVDRLLRADIPETVDNKVRELLLQTPGIIENSRSRLALIEVYRYLVMAINKTFPLGVFNNPPSDEDSRKIVTTIVSLFGMYIPEEISEIFMYICTNFHKYASFGRKTSFEEPVGNNAYLMDEPLWNATLLMTDYDISTVFGIPLDERNNMRWDVVCKFQGWPGPITIKENNGVLFVSGWKRNIAPPDTKILQQHVVQLELSKYLKYVIESDGILSYVDDPSIGVGIPLEHMYILLFMSDSRGKKITPANKELLDDAFKRFLKAVAVAEILQDRKVRFENQVFNEAIDTEINRVREDVLIRQLSNLKVHDSKRDKSPTNPITRPPIFPAANIWEVMGISANFKALPTFRSTRKVDISRITSMLGEIDI
jgi:hypothetical protein